MTECSKKHAWMKIAVPVKDRPQVQSYKGCEDLTPIPVSFPSKGSIGETGDWRTFRPVIDHEKCSSCGLCFLYCPEGVVRENEEGFFEIDYKYCKGCGICAHSCKTGALTMVRESEAKDSQVQKASLAKSPTHEEV